MSVDGRITFALYCAGFAAWIYGALLERRFREAYDRRFEVNSDAEMLAARDAIYARPWLFLPILVRLWLRETRRSTMPIPQEPALESARRRARIWLGVGIALIIAAFGLFLLPLAPYAF